MARSSGWHGRVSVEVRPCSCRHAFQDQRYGRGRRLMRAGKSGEFKCTVCQPTQRRVDR